MSAPEAFGDGDPNFRNPEFRALLAEQGFSKLEGLLFPAGSEQPAIEDESLFELVSYAPSEQSALVVASHIRDRRSNLFARADIAGFWDDAELKLTILEEIRPRITRRPRNETQRTELWNLGMQVALRMREPSIIDLVANPSDRERMHWAYAEHTGDLDLIRKLRASLGDYNPYYLDMLKNVIAKTDKDIAPYIAEFPISDHPERTADDKRKLDEVLLARVMAKKDMGTALSIQDEFIRLRALVWLASEDGDRQVADGLYDTYKEFFRKIDPKNFVSMLEHYIERVDAQAPIADLRAIAFNTGEEPDQTWESEDKTEALCVLAGTGDADAATILLEEIKIDTVPDDQLWRHHKALANISIGLKDPKWALMIHGNGGERQRDKAFLQIAILTQSASIFVDPRVEGSVSSQNRDELIRQYCTKTGDYLAAHLIKDLEIRRQTTLGITVRSGLEVGQDELDAEDTWEAMEQFIDDHEAELVDKNRISEMENHGVQLMLYSKHYLKGDVTALSDMHNVIESAPDSIKFYLLTALTMYTESIDDAYRALQSFITQGPDTFVGMSDEECGVMIDGCKAMFRNIKLLEVAEAA